VNTPPRLVRHDTERIRWTRSPPWYSVRMPNNKTKGKITAGGISAPPKSSRGTARLQPLTAALLECVTPADVAAVVVDRGISVLGARAGLEALALLALVPLLRMLSASDLQSGSRLVGDVRDLLGHPTPTKLAITLAVFALALYVAKSVAAIGVMRWTFCWSYPTGVS